MGSYSTLYTDARLLKHQAVSIHFADLIFIVLERFYIKMFHLQKNIETWN